MWLLGFEFGEFEYCGLGCYCLAELLKLFYEKITVQGEDVVDGLEPMIEPSGPKLRNENRAIGLKLQQLVHVRGRFLLEICRHQH